MAPFTPVSGSDPADRRSVRGLDLATHRRIVETADRVCPDGGSDGTRTRALHLSRLRSGDAPGGRRAPFSGERGAQSLAQQCERSTGSLLKTSRTYLVATAPPQASVIGVAATFARATPARARTHRARMLRRRTARTIRRARNLGTAPTRRTRWSIPA